MGQETMNVRVSTVAGLAATAVLVGVTVAGCGTSPKPSTTSTTTATTSTTTATTSTTTATTSTTATGSTAAQADYSALLIKPDDISLPGDSFTAEPAVQNPKGKPGVEIVFTSHTTTRRITDTIAIFPDASAATAALDKEKATYTAPGLQDVVTEPVAVGSGGILILNGLTPNESILFAEGKAYLTLSFQSAQNDKMSTEFAVDVGQKQDAAIKKGLPG